MPLTASIGLQANYQREGEWVCVCGGATILIRIALLIPVTILF
jgi:hypothetical protein